MLTKGWDTISIIKQDRINAELAASWDKVDPTFYYEFEEEGRYIKGEFDPWKIIDGGGGKLLRMELPIRSGELNLNGTIYNLEGVSAVVSFTLSLIPKPDKTYLKTAYIHLAKDSSQITDEEGWILPITIIDEKGTLGVLGSVVLDGICNYLIDHSDQLVLFFAEVDFTKEGCPDWLLPHKAKYSYLDSGYLCILAVCDDRDISSLPLDIDVSGLSFEGDSYFIISSKKVLTNMILPGVYPMYQDADESDFTITDTGFKNNRELEMDEIKSGAIYYTPVVYSDGNEGSIEGSRLNVKYNGYCDMYAGIDMYWNGNVSMSVYLKDNHIISFKKESSDFDHDEDIPWYLAFLIPIVGIIVNIVVLIISDDLIDEIEDNSASLDAAELNTTDWFGKTGVLNAAYLSEALVLQYS